MKQAIKAILPKPVIDKAIDIRDRLRLTLRPRQGLDPGKLRSAAALDFRRIFADDDITGRWEQDHRGIATRYGHEDWFAGVNPGDRRAIYFLVMALRPRNVLEVGTHIGASTLYIAAALKQLGEGGIVTTVDIIDVNDAAQGPWKKLGMDRAPRDYASDLGLSDSIAFRVGPCLEFMAKTGQRFDLIFLDGDHSAPAVYQEVGAALPLLNENGLILLHDYYPGAESLYPDRAMIGGPFHAMQRIRRECPAITVVPLGELPWPTKQGMNVTSLAVVARGHLT
jgi:predicted O-methyltransferase YrrM